MIQRYKIVSLNVNLRMIFLCLQRKSVLFFSLSKLTKKENEGLFPFSFLIRILTDRG